MQENVIQFFSVVSIGGFIGWITNYLAIKMLFRPYKKVNLLFFSIQGVIPKRKGEITGNIAEVIEKELLSFEDIKKNIDISKVKKEQVDSLVDKIINEKLKKSIVEKNPLLKMFLSDSIINLIKNKVSKSIYENREEILIELFKTIEKEIDLKQIMIDKMNDFSLEKVEEIILSVSKKELKHIEIIGGILGMLIAVFQFFIIKII